MPRCPRLTHVVGVALAIAVTASPLAGAASKTPKAPAKVSASKQAVPTTFPKVKVIDLATSKTVDLASLNVTTKPQLVWFWAPT